MPKMRLFAAGVKEGGSARTAPASLLVALLLLSPPALAADPDDSDGQQDDHAIVVSANRVATDSSKIGSAVTVITAEDIARQQANTVAEVLRTVPGLSIANYGTTGSQTDVRIRGAEAWHTKLIIDGVDMADPSSTRPSFDFGHLLASDIERIEILRGPQSLLYGSDSIGGVISITTRKGKGKPKVTASAEAGSYHTYKGSAGLSGSEGAASYAISATRFQTDGISSGDQRNGNSENDGYQASSASARLGYQITDAWSVETSLRAMNDRLDYDRYNSTTRRAEDDNSWFRKRDRSARLATTFSPFGPVLENTLAYSVQESKRDYQDGDLSGGSAYFYDGESQKLDYQGTARLNEHNTVVFGAETKTDSTTQGGGFSLPGHKDVSTAGYFADYQVSPFDALFLTVGGRLDDHETFGTHTTYRTTAAYLVEATQSRLHSSYGTGFRAPSLSELYLPVFGTPTLRPEESRGWDAGIEQSFLDGKGSVDLTWFNNRIKDMITTQTVGGVTTFTNLSSTRTQGLEATARWELSDDWRLSGNYTFTDSRNNSTGQILAYRAKHQGSLSATWLPLDGLETTASLRAVGNRYSSNTNRMLGGFAVVNLAGAYDLTEGTQLYGRVENLLDKTYSEIDTYGTYGRAAYVGVRTSF